MHNRVFLCIFVSLIAISGAIAQPAKTKTKTNLETLRKELETIQHDWAKHRGQDIIVLKIDGLKSGASQGEKKTLERRLETLQNKKISNREWATYWRLEAQYAEQTVRLYQELAPMKGTSLLKLEQIKKKRSAEAAAIVARSKNDALQRERQALENAETGVRDLMNLNAGATQVNQEQLDQLAAALDSTSARISKIDQDLKKNPSERKRVKLIEAKIISANELADLEKRHEAVQEAIGVLTQTQAVISSVLQGQGVPAEGLEPAIITTLSNFLKGRQGVAGAQAGFASAQSQARTLEDASTRARLEFERFSTRQPALDLWATLAQKKVKNQDLYYDAISADISAVNDRLRSVRKSEKQEETVHAQDVCDADLKNEETEYAHYRNCTRAIHEELRMVNAELDQAKQQQKLSKRLGSSVAQLIKAQVIDVTLVNEEESISSGESKRSIASKTETADWRHIWKTFQTRSAAKRSKLSEALKESKISERELNAKLGVYGDALKRLTDQKARSAEYLNNHDTIQNKFIALLSTGWQIVTVGWPALIYLLFAFLLIRLIRKHRDKQEAKAKLTQEGQGNEELDHLTAELDQALAEKNDPLVVQLTKEIGHRESRIKDEGQRIATIARVAAQALTLVIYVATGLLVLDALTIDIKPILGGAAIFGLAISFGSQSLVKDVVSGFFILLENQYAVDDVVTINDHSGTVEKITLRRTVLRDTKGGVHNITNGSISSVTNSTQGWARVIAHLGVAYDTDVDKVAQVINSLGEEMYNDPEWRGKLTEKPVFVGVTAFGESEITVRAQFKTRTFHNWSAEREFNLRVKMAFEKAGIQIPFPQRELRIVREMEAAVTKDKSDT